MENYESGENTASLNNLMNSLLIEKKKRTEKYWVVLNSIIDEFYALAERIYNTVSCDKPSVVSSVEAMINAACDKIEEFDVANGQAFNFFTIVMLQEFRSHYAIWEKGVN